MHRFTIAPLHLVFAAFLTAQCLEAEPPARNVLLIMVDDLNTSLSCYGEDEVATPNLDALAEQGVRFERAYCQYPSCGPSRVSMLTGLRPDRSRVYLNEVSNRIGRPNAITLPQLFRQHGFFTGRVGKIFHMGIPPVQVGYVDDPISWDRTVDPRGSDYGVEDQLHNYTPKRGLGWGVSWLDLPEEAGKLTDELVTDHAIAMLQEAKDRPFFVAAGYFRPHPPQVAPRRHFDRVPLESITLPGFNPAVFGQAPEAAFTIKPPNYGLEPEKLRKFKRAYLACISFIDEQVGRLLKAVDDLGLAKNTLVVFVSDQGFMLGQHGQWQKGLLFEDALRVPLIIRHPGKAAAGGVAAAPVELVDLYPTIAVAAGLSPPEDLDGDNLLPLLDDPGLRSVTGPAFTVHQLVNKGEYARSVATEQWRYVRRRGGEAHELYNLMQDPSGAENLADDPEYASTRAGLAALIDEQLRRYPPDVDALKIQMVFPPDLKRLRELPVPPSLE